MLNRIIADRLKDHRRLVIPKLGAFIVKEADGKILFSELLRGDDGVLRGLVKASGVGDIEAAGVIDRFVFEVRNTLDGGRPYAIGDLGVLRRGANGAITFVQKETPRSVAIERAVRVGAASSTSAPRISGDKVADGNRAEAPESGGRNARPAVARRPKRRRGADLFLLIAVIIAALAVAVMVYGYFRTNEQEEVSLREMFFPSSPSSSEPVDLSVPSGVAESGSDAPAAE